MSSDYSCLYEAILKTVEKVLRTGNEKIAR